MDQKTQQLVEALALAVRELPDGAEKTVSLLALLADTDEPKAVLAALPFIWRSSHNPFVATRLAGRSWLRWTLARLGFPIGTWVRSPVPQDVKAAAHIAVSRLISALSPEVLPRFDDMIRGMGRDAWAINGGRGRWAWIAPPLPNEVDEGPARIQLLGLLASHADGHVREAAVTELAASPGPEALPFLLWRSADWVRPVQDRALAAVRERLRVEFAPVFSRLLPLIRRLELLKRVDLSALVADIRRLLLQEPGQASLIASLRSNSRFVRREACRVLDKLAPVPGSDILDLALGSDDVVVRLWVLSWEERLRSTVPTAAAELRTRLASDSSSRIRGHALRAMVDLNDGPAAVRLRQALLDTSPSVRQLARFYLGKLDRSTDFAAWYRAALSPGGVRTASAIAGLGETGVSADCQLMLSFLSGTPRQARAALKAAVNLDADSCHDVLLATLTDQRDGVCREALSLLGRRLPEQEGTTLERLWLQAVTTTSRRAIAEAMLRLPPWPALLALLHSTQTDPDSNEGVATLALARWRPEHRANYAPSPPPVHMRDRVEKALQVARAILPSETANRIQEVLDALTTG